MAFMVQHIPGMPRPSRSQCCKWNHRAMKSSRGYISSLIWQFCSQLQVAFPVREAQANFCVPFVQPHGRASGKKLVQSWVFWGNSGLACNGVSLHILEHAMSQPLISKSTLGFLCKPWWSKDEQRQNSPVLQPQIRTNISCPYIYCLHLCHISSTYLKASSFSFPSSKLLEGRA